MCSAADVFGLLPNLEFPVLMSEEMVRRLDLNCPAGTWEPLPRFEFSLVIPKDVFRLAKSVRPVGVGGSASLFKFWILISNVSPN